MEFKFFQKIVVIGSGQKVGVVCYRKYNFDEWFRDLFFKGSIIIGNVEYHRDAKYYPIMTVRNARGMGFHSTISLPCAESNREIDDIKSILRHCMINEEI